MYAVLLLSVGFLGWVEKQDLECSNIFSSTDECGEGKGMPFRGTIPTSSDDCNTLLDKTVKAAGIEERSIKWRRALVVGTIISLLIWLLAITPGCLPDWDKMYLTVIVSFSILYFYMNFFSYHIVRTGEQYAKQSAAEIRSKKCSF